MLIGCAGGDGNMLLNVGPMPNRTIATEQANLISKWARGWRKRREYLRHARGPFKPGDYGVSTRKGKTVFVHILKWPEGPVKLPNIAAKIVGAKLLSAAS